MFFKPMYAEANKKYQHIVTILLINFRFFDPELGDLLVESTKECINELY